MRSYLALVRARLATFLRFGVCVLGAPNAFAQSDALVFVMNTTESALDAPGTGQAQRVFLPGEVAIVTPDASASYAARSFLSYDAQWTYLGDADADGQFVGSASSVPGATIDALFVKRYPAPQAATGPRDVYVSVDSSADLGGLVEDGAVFRFAGGGVIDVFLREQQLQDALGLFGDQDLEAICQDAEGNLYVSVGLSQGPFGYATGIHLIPTNAITYDADGNVASVTSGSAVKIADRTQLCAWLQISGFVDETGASPGGGSSLCFFGGSGFSVTSLELDPAGGTWTSPVTGAQHPNLVFSWNDDRNDGGLVGSRNGGTFPTVNGVPMASTVATDGSHLGLLPTGVGSVQGLAFLPTGTPLTLENWPESLVPAVGGSPTTRQELDGATPGGLAAFFWSPTGSTAGTAAPVTTLGAPFTGALFGPGPYRLNGIVPADPSGYASFTAQLPPSVFGSGSYVVLQAYDLASMTFSTPSSLDFRP